MRKAQAAMEFLMTYGWAILVVLVAIGALAYFGVLSPDRFLPESCTITPGLACTGYKISATAATGMTLKINDGLGNAITVSAAQAPTIAYGDPEVTCTLSACTPTLPTTINNGDDITCTGTGPGCDAGDADNRFKGTITFEYTLDGIDHQKTGSITTKIEG